MDTVIIDVRQPEEFRESHVEGAVNVPLDQISTSPYISTIEKNTPIILYCASGNRSGMADHLLKQTGFSNVTNGINQTNVEALLGRS